MQAKHSVYPLFITLLFSASCAWADMPSLTLQNSDAAKANASFETSTVANTTSDDLKAQAKRWGLSSDDYARYLDLMKNTPAGRWYKNSDPTEVLAINARNEAEREHYAEIIAKSTHDRLENELAMQRAFNIAWQKLYPDVKPIALPSEKTSQQNHVNLQAGDQLLLFTDLNNTSNGFMLPALFPVIEQHAGIKLGIFIVGNSVSDKAIQDWAKQNQIPLKLVEQGSIVLDHDKGRFAQMAKGAGSLPTLILNHQGRFNVVSLNDLNKG